MVSIKKQANSFCTYYLWKTKVTRAADYSAILQEAGYTRNGAWYMFLYGGEYIPFAVIIGIMDLYCLLYNI